MMSFNHSRQLLREFQGSLREFRNPQQVSMDLYTRHFWWNFLGLWIIEEFTVITGGVLDVIERIPGVVYRGFRNQKSLQSFQGSFRRFQELFKFRVHGFLMGFQVF